MYRCPDCVQISLLTFVFTFSGLELASAQELAETTDATVAAWVNDQPVPATRVAAHIKTTLGDRKLAGTAKQVAQATAIEHLVNRRVLFDYLQQKKFAASQSLVDLEVEKFEKQLSRIEKSLRQHLLETKQTREQLSFEFSWKLAWSAYLDRYLTEQNIQRFFNRNRRKYDGTEMKVAHLLLKSDDLKSATEQANSIRTEIQAGELDWPTAVGKFSDAPSKDKAGEMGWISYTEPMPPDFSKAAFQLEKGQLSQPVVSKFGVHLIRCIDIQPGSKGLAEVKNRVVRDATEFLFNKLSGDHRPNVQVRYNDQFPHFVLDGAGKARLVVPEK